MLLDWSSDSLNRSLKLWLCGNSIEMYLIPDVGNSVIAERFIRILKSKIYYHMTVVSKNLYNDKLNKIVNKYNNIYNRMIKIKPADVKPWMYLEHETPKFKVGDCVKKSKYKTFLQRATL